MDDHGTDDNEKRIHRELGYGTNPIEDPIHSEHPVYTASRGEFVTNHPIKLYIYLGPIQAESTTNNNSISLSRLSHNSHPQLVINYHRNRQLHG